MLPNIVLSVWYNFTTETKPKIRYMISKHCHGFLCLNLDELLMSLRKSYENWMARDDLNDKIACDFL